MNHQTLPKMLADIDLFAGVGEDVLSELVSAGATFTTQPGSIAVAQGSSGAGLHVVLDGSADVEVNGVGRPAMGPGDYFGEMSVIDGAGRSATVTAGDQGLTTFAISPANFSALIDRHPELARVLLRALCARLRRLEASNPS